MSTPPNLFGARLFAFVAAAAGGGAGLFVFYYLFYEYKFPEFVTVLKGGQSLCESSIWRLSVSYVHVILCEKQENMT
jgi:hypothetical protein